MAGQYEEYLSTFPIVIDNGSGMMKAGVAGEEQPNLVFPTIIGRPKHKKVLPSSIEANIHIGPNEKIRGLMNISYPIRHGIITDVQDMRSIWNHVYSELKLPKKDHPVLLTEPAFNPKSNKHNIAETFFESMDAPAIFIAQQAILSLYAFGKTTGLVVESGDGVTQCVPVYEGYSIQNAVERIDLGGRDITEYLRLLLRRSGYNFVTSSEFEVVKKIKEQSIEIAESKENFNSVTKKIDQKNHKNYYLPDGTPISLGSERFYAPELMFDPSKLGFEFEGIHELAHSALKKSDIDLRKHLYKEIILTGGNTGITGLPERLLNELTTMVPKDVTVKIFAPPDSSKACWMGGSIVSNLGSFKKMWISKKEYSEQGDRIFDMKQF